MEQTERRKRALALYALVGWWRLLDSQTRPLPDTSSERMLAMLRRGDGRGMESMQPFYDLYELAEQIENLAGVTLDKAREWMNDAGAAGTPLNVFDLSWDCDERLS